MKYIRRYLTNVLSIPNEYVIDRNKISMYFIDSNEDYTMLYKQENKDSEIYKIIKRRQKYNKEKGNFEIVFDTEDCTEDTFKSFKKVKQGKMIEKNRVVVKIDDIVTYVEDYIDHNLTIAKVVFENINDFRNFPEFNFLDREISREEEYDDIDLKLSNNL